MQCFTGIYLDLTIQIIGMITKVLAKISVVEILSVMLVNIFEYSLHFLCRNISGGIRQTNVPADQNQYICEGIAQIIHTQRLLGSIFAQHFSKITFDGLHISQMDKAIHPWKIREFYLFQNTICIENVQRIWRDW